MTKVDVEKYLLMLQEYIFHVFFILVFLLHFDIIIIIIMKTNLTLLSMEEKYLYWVRKYFIRFLLAFYKKEIQLKFMFQIKIKAFWYFLTPHFNITKKFLSKKWNFHEKKREKNFWKSIKKGILITLKGHFQSFFSLLQKQSTISSVSILRHDMIPWTWKHGSHTWSKNNFLTSRNIFPLGLLSKSDFILLPVLFLLLCSHHQISSLIYVRTLGNQNIYPKVINILCAQEIYDVRLLITF